MTAPRLASSARQAAPADVPVPRDAEPSVWSLIDHAATAAAVPAPGVLKLTRAGGVRANGGTLSIGLPVLALTAAQVCSLVAAELAADEGRVAERSFLKRLFGRQRRDQRTLDAAATASTPAVAAAAVRESVLAQQAWPMFEANWLTAVAYTRSSVDVVDGFAEMLAANRDDLAAATERAMDVRTGSATPRQRAEQLASRPASTAPVDDRRAAALFARLGLFEETLMGGHVVAHQSWDDAVSSGFEKCHIASADEWCEVLEAAGALQDGSLADVVTRLSQPDWQQVITRAAASARECDLPKAPTAIAQLALKRVVLGSLLAQRLVFVALNWHRDNDVLGLESEPWDIDALVRDVPGDPAAAEALLTHVESFGVDLTLRPGTRPRSGRYAVVENDQPELAAAV